MPPCRGVLYEQMKRLPLSWVPSSQAIELNEVDLVGIGHAAREGLPLLDAADRIPQQPVARAPRSADRPQ